MRELMNEVLKWANDRGILDESDAKTQLVKTMEEMGELSRGLLKNDKALIEDSYGDVLVTLIIGAELAGYDLELCLETALNEIQGRRGKMVNNVFAKEED